MLVVIAALLLAACTRSGGIEARASDYGETWPFTVARGTLRCAQEDRRSGRRHVTFDVGNGIEYGLNGSARAFGFPNGLTILKADKHGADLQPFITRGLSLCGHK